MPPDLTNIRIFYNLSVETHLVTIAHFYVNANFVGNCKPALNI